MPYLRRVTTKRAVHWQARVFVGRDGNGKRMWAVKTFKSERKKDAERWAREQMTRRDSGTIVAGKCTMGALFDHLVLYFKINRKSAWGPWVVERFLRPYFGHMLAERVTTTTIQEYIAARQDAGVVVGGRKREISNGTINRELTVLKRAFSLAMKSTPPKVTRMPQFMRLAEAPPRKGFFEPQEYKAILAQLPDDLKPVLVFAYYTGCRRGEILSLQWPQVDLVDRIIRLEPGTTKNKEARTIPLTREVVEVLKMQRQFRDQFYPMCPWVFFRHSTGKQVSGFKRAWRSASKRAGLWDEALQRPTRLLHDSRRTGVRNLVRAGVPERVAMAISGHKTRSIFDRYNIVSEADLKVAAVQLDTYLEKRRTEGVRNAIQSVPTTAPNDRKSLN